MTDTLDEFWLFWALFSACQINWTLCSDAEDDSVRFSKKNNVINVTVYKEFVKLKNHIHHVLHIWKRFLIAHESYTDNF